MLVRKRIRMVVILMTMLTAVLVGSTALLAAAPTIASITSTTADGAYKQGDNIDVTINFSEDVTLSGGNLNVTLNTSAVVVITTIHTASTVSATYTVGASQTSSALNVTSLALAPGATLRNAGREDADLLTLPAGDNLADNKDIVVDTATPNDVTDLSSTSHSTSTWSNDNTIESLEDWVQATNIESLDWLQATTANTIQGYERYVQLHGEGKHVAEAKDNIESLHWQQATNANTIRSYQTYTSAHPQGRFAQQAETKATALRTDQGPYEAALRTGTDASLTAFLADYPVHTKETAAQSVLRDITEGRDIVDLLHEKKVEIQAEGSGIESVSLRMRRLVPYALTVCIPVGSFFVSSNSSVQNMVTTAETKVQLTTEEWKSVSPDAACANRARDIPGSGDTFTVQRSSHQAELTKLMPMLDRAGADIETKQAAVWIVTDNADYDDLGILVASQFGFGGSRVINEQETATAMRICDEAGIDITRKAIWRDRQQIISGLKDGDLKTWLEQKK